MLNRCIVIHTYMSWTEDWDYRTNYGERVLGVLGAKGTLLFVVLAVVVVLAASAPQLVSEPVAGVLVAVALGGAVALDTEIAEDAVDPVGLSLLFVVVAYTAAVAFGASPGWLSALGASALFLAATAYGYVRDSEYADPVGLLATGALAIYALLRLTGWTEFAHSPVFAALVFSVGAGFVAVFARPTRVEREVKDSQDAELYRLVLGILNEVADVTEEDVREDIASKMRLVAGRLGGVKIPTEVEDSHGGVPVALPDVSSDSRREDVTVEEVIETADDERFTGYVVHGDAVLMFRNGTFFKGYTDGEFGHSADFLGDRKADAAFFSLGHMPLNDLDDLTPTDEEVVTPEEAERERAETGGDADEGTLQVGGDEIDIDEMFEKADDIIEDLSD